MAEKHDGYSSSSLITQLRESPSKPGVIWIGTDDGLLQLSRDGGETFTNVFDNVAAAGLPKGYVQTARIEPSHFDGATAYVAFDNHRCCDDWKPYLFKTTDYGKTWSNVAGNLPGHGVIQALREDYDNPNLLFVGTEFGLYVTLDGGKDWKKFMINLPTVPVDDILIHPRDRDLIIGTHGRSIWIMDDITPLEQLKAGANADLVLFDPRPAVLWKNDPQSQRHAANREFKAQNPQGGTAISIWAKSDAGKGKVEFLQNDKVVSTIEVDLKAGMNRVQWNMRGPVPPAPAGGGRGGRGGGGGGGGGSQPAHNGPGPASGVPFVAGGGRGGGFGGAPQGPLMDPGTFMVRLTVGGETRMSSVDVLEDIWMRPQ
jgi:Sortilin, neurotensin receptor 3,